jgi:hypothetical protein
MDEIFGYLPPYPQNPPSKEPLMILLKQARAFGLGVVLATQNTKDIDYKALTNMGTWFVGKLQAEGDRQRVIEGLTGVALESGKPVESSQLKEMFASLGKRKFLAQNVHSKGIKIFQTRWAMSFLAGPLTREQIKGMTEEQKQAVKKQEVELPQPAPEIKKKIHLLPYLPQPEIPMESIYDNSGASQGYYSPFLHLDGEIIFDEQHLGLYIRKKYFATAPLKASVNWREASIGEEPIQYSDEPAENIDGYEPLKIKLNYSLLRRLQSSFKNFLFTNLSLDLFVNKELNLVSGTGESREVFAQKCRDVVEKMIDKEIEQKKEYFDRKINRIEDKMDRERLKIERLEREHKSKRTEEFLSAGETVLGFLLGSKSRRGFSAAARRRRATSSVADRVKLKKAKLSQLEEELVMLQEELEDSVADIEDLFYEKADNIEPFEVRLEKNDIIISHQAILWKLL